MMNLRYALIALYFIFGAAGVVRAAEPVSAQTVLAGSTAKTLARAFIATANIEDVKNNSIEKLNRMGPANYGKQYAKYYRVIKDLPAALKTKYGFTQDLPKAKMIKIIRSLDKKQFYTIIEAVPNATIARVAGAYFNDGNPAVKDKSFIERVQMGWAEIMGDMASKPPARQH
ncbi:MAG: hypothetical protein HQL17_07850 [Candidatus Omnitrophica bacterium]|nr:hypothetical protein [Candidatus Omnitrophota bacterium]